MIQGLAKYIGSIRDSATAAANDTRGPSWHYFAILGVLANVLALFFKEAYIGTALHPIQVPIASITTSLLSFLDIHVIQQGTVLVHASGFACEITPGCTGLIAILLYLVAVLLYPTSTANKATGLLIGIPFLVAINFIRLVHLVYIGVYHITWFDLAHWVIWQALIALAVVAAWWVWTGWSWRNV